MKIMRCDKCGVHYEESEINEVRIVEVHRKGRPDTISLDMCVLCVGILLSECMGELDENNEM